MDAQAEVLAAATERAKALGRGDQAALEALLHPAFVWTSHKGDRFDRDGYLRSNSSGRAVWHGQQLDEVEIRVLGDVAVLRCLVTDDVTVAGDRELFRMPMTQTWVREHGRWLCLAGHAGPRLVAAGIGAAS